MIAFGVLLLCLGFSLGQQFTCPPEGGFYADPHQCDKYYDCYRGEKTDKMCPDGLVFDATVAPRVEQCNYPFIVFCPETSVLQPAQPSGIECPRRNGYFEHEDPSNCEQYYECFNGAAIVRKCHKGLVFDELTGSCQWEHAGFRSGCGARKMEVLEDGFSCPNKTQLTFNGHSFDHTRYPNQEDCRYFYLCSEGVDPSKIGCPDGTVFNDISLNCDAPENVPGCEFYYDPEPRRPPIANH